MIKRILLYAGLGLGGLAVVAGVAVGAAYLVLSNMTFDQPSGGAGASASASLDPSFSTELEPFVTNLADQRYVSVKFHLYANNAEGVAKLQQNVSLVRDDLLSLLNTKKAVDVAGEAGQAALKSEVQTRLNKLLGETLVQRVLLTDFVVQY